MNSEYDVLITDTAKYKLLELISEENNQKLFFRIIFNTESESESESESGWEFQLDVIKLENEVTS